MVFFNCGQCGESMRKAQVEKHYKFKCRSCQCLSCVDCGKEFWGEDYQKHTKCISEDEKYGGKDYKPKPNANKGERKQEEWTDQVQNTIDKCKDAKLRSYLEKMKDYSNIPRKKAKFENFLKNSMRIPAYLATQLWEVISAETMAAKMNGSPEQESPVTNGQEKSPIDAATEEKTSQNGESKKLNKRERKEERQKKAGKKQKKDKAVVESVQEETGEKVKEKKKRKRKHTEEEDPVYAEETENLDSKSKKKRKQDLHERENADGSANKEEDQPGQKKKKRTANGQLRDCSLNESINSQESDPDQNVSKKFNWENVIAEVLKQEDDHELRLKKLKKKVLAEYYNRNPNGHVAEEKISVKFDRKVSKNSKFKVHKDRVKLLS